MPPSLGVKPRKYCSRRCTNAAYGLRPKPESVSCRSCGKTVAQSGKGRTRWHCSSACRRQANHRKKVHKRHCKKCGCEFVRFKQSKYCSEECRWPNRTAVRPCERCGVDFKQKHHASRFCSNSCSAASTFHLRPLARKPVVRKCSNCEIPFVRKKFKSGGYSVATKYCSRECAFEARRLKKKCAERPLEIANKLATWFLSWVDDRRPSKKSCVRCGVDRRWTKNSPEPPDLCLKCERHRQGRKCRACGVLMPWSANRRVCNHCRDENQRESRRKSKRKYGRNHKQRTRRRGAPYTPIRNSSIYERDNWECQICCRPLEREWRRLKRGDTPSPRARTVDHVIPLAQGKDSPGHVWHNLIACCHECNTAKCDKDPTGWHCSLPRTPDPFALP